MEIYRGIALNEGENINNENLGCSWSLCSVFAKKHARSIAKATGKEGVIVLTAEISEDAIDIDNTLYAMEKRPYEYEVVVTGSLVCEVCYSELEEIEEGTEIEGSVGYNDFEDYNNNYEGSLTMPDFLTLADEF